MGRLERLTDEEARQAFANMGQDYDKFTPESARLAVKRLEECGACASQFYTGVNLYEHTCGFKHRPKAKITSGY